MCLCPASAGEQVPHLPETVLKMAGHGEAVRVWASVPGADSHHNLVLPGIVADSKAVLHHCSEAEEYVVVGHWDLKRERGIGSDAVNT